jgi:hypothetical protein
MVNLGIYTSIFIIYVYVIIFHNDNIELILVRDVYCVKYRIVINNLVLMRIDMNVFTSVWIPIISAVISAIIGSIITWLLVSPREYFLPLVKSRSKNKYIQLSRIWHEYHITNDKKISSSPFWSHSQLDLTVFNKSRVKGSCINMNNPQTDLKHNMRGEIRADVLAMSFSCDQVFGDIGIMIFSNILGGEYLLGFANGLDYDKNAFSSPSVLSKIPLDATKLNSIISTHTPNFINNDLSPSLLPDKITN